MKTIAKNIKVTKIKTNSVGIKVPAQVPGNEGITGRYYHHIMNLGNHKGADLESLETEVKTRKRGSKAPHTTGTMIFDDIVATPWEDTTFAKKRQRVYQVEHDNTFDENTVVDETMIDMTKPEIQDVLKRDYENARTTLAKLGKDATGTIVGGEFGILEHRSGNTWAHRIPDAGYKKIKSMAKSTFDDLFDFT